MASIFDFFKNNKAVEPAITEQRTDTIPGQVVMDWDSAFAQGKNYDKLSVIYGCVNLRASTVASLPIQFNKKIDKGYEAAKDHPYYDLITKSPNNFQTPYTFWHWVMVQLDTFGNAYIQKVRNNAGLVIELIPLNAYTVEVRVDENGLPFYKVNMTQADGSSYYKQYENDQIIHFKGYSRNGIYGLSPVDTFRSLYDGYGELETAGTAISKNAAKPSGIVYYPQNMGEDALEKLKAGWKQGFSGTSSGKSAFIPNTIKVEGSPVGLSADQIQYIEQKKFSAQRIASDIFRVPLHMLGLSTSPTFASVEQSSIEWVSYTITPIVTNLEQQLQKQLLDNDDEYYVNFNVNGLLRGDIKTRIEFYRFGIEHGILTPNDVHEQEGTGITIPEEKGGNSYIRPLNFAVVGTPVAAPVALAQTTGSIETNSCPIETQDIAANLANRLKAVNVAHYGPANPQMPNAEFWAAKAKLFNTSVDEAKSMKCGNCAAFNVSKRMKDCINTGIGADSNEVEAQVGGLGYCELFDFKCAAARTCDAWLTGGPITDENTSALLQNENSGSISSTL
jgi:HK97 family phage portal protein